MYYSALSVALRLLSFPFNEGLKGEQVGFVKNTLDDK